MRRTTRLLAAVSVAGALALTACGGDDGGGDGGGDGGSSEGAGSGTGGDTGDAQDPDRVGPVTIEGATEGGIVKMISVTPLETMDPSESYYTHTAGILSGLVTRSLTQYVYDPEANGGAGGVTLVPDLAEDLGTPNDDFTEWTFKIREGLKYEDGTDIKLADYKFGMERTMDLAAFPESPGFYATDYYEGGADYKGPYTGKGATLDAISIDEAASTITIKMAKPFPDMPYWAAFPANGPIPNTPASAPDKYRLHPLATGPYMFSDYTPKEKLTLVRNPNWDPATDPGRTAYPDGYEMDFTVPTEKVDEIILNDQGDAKNTMTFDDIDGATYRKFQDQASDRIKTGTTPCTRYWAFDQRTITDKRISQAIAYAYPTAAAIKAAGALYGITRVPATTLLPPGTPGREDYAALPDYTPGTPDPEKAKALLAEADAEGFEVKYLFATDDPNAVAAKDAIKKGLEAGGFKATPVPTTLENLTTVREDPNADINVRSAGWCADWPSGGSWFPVLHKTEDVEALGQISQNYSLFASEDVDERIIDIQGAPIEDQPAQWSELDKYITEEYFPLFPISYDGTVWAGGSNVNGNYSDIVFGMPTFKNMWLAGQ